MRVIFYICVALLLIPLLEGLRLMWEGWSRLRQNKKADDVLSLAIRLR
jgi:hypothetical protein